MAKKKDKKDDIKAVDLIKMKYGEEAAITLGGGEVTDCPSISTGSMNLDMAIGVGGLPQGRIIEVYGPESSGKTTLALSTIACAQKLGGKCAFIDAEHAIDPIYTENLGVNLSELLFTQPSSGEQALDIADMLVKSGEFEIVVIDSVAALTPQAELDGEMGEQHVGRQARMMGQAMRKLVAAVKKTNTMLIFINQIRMKIGVMFGSPETTPGGNALKFYASVRLHMARIATIKNGDDPIGNKTRVTVRKNKVAPPFKKAEFDIIFGKGINRAGELIDLGIEYNVLKKSGSWLSHGDQRLGQGRGSVCDLLNEDHELCRKIEKELFTAMKKVDENESPKTKKSKPGKNEDPKKAGETL